MKNYIFVGCDSHEEILVNKFAHNDGPIEMKKMSARRAGRQKLIEYFKEQSRRAEGAQVVVVYEASAHGFILCDQLREAGFLCHVLAPTKIERSSKQKRNKTDERDAERLLDIVRGHYLAGTKMPAVWVPDAQTRDDREPVRARQDLSEKLSTVKTQVQMLLKRHGLEKPEDGGKNWTKRHRQWVQALSQDGPPIQLGMRQALKTLLRQVQFLEHEIEQIDESMRELANTTRRKSIVDALIGEKGVGLTTALKYATDIGDFTRFRRGRQIGAFFGLAPSSNESGENNDRKGHITRAGSPSARQVLCQATWSRVQHDKQEREVYQRLVAKNPKKKKIALVACMRRLAVRLWHIGLEAQLRMEAAPIN
jgi:transposase